MATHNETLRLRLAAGPQSGTQLAKDMGISQPTVSRALAAMNDEVMQIGARKTRATCCVMQGEALPT